MDEIIPKAHLSIKSDNLEAEWSCPACGWINEVFLFSERLKDARLEMHAIDNVKCTSCGRKFDT